MAISTYYFDGSDAVATDPNNVWVNETNADDGNTATVATSNTGGSSSSNYLKIEGTNAPSSGGNITSVRARVYGKGTTNLGSSRFVTQIYTDGGVSSGELLGFGESLQDNTSQWMSYFNLSTPTGGWTWAKIQGLEQYTYLVTSSGLGVELARIEIEVTSENTTSPFPSFRRQ